MTKGETELEMIPYVEGGEMVIVWQKHREGLGNTIEITTGKLQSSALFSVYLELLREGRLQDIKTVLAAK